jgi:hypothetical protein
MTQDPNNRGPITIPAGYQREDYAAIVPLVEAGEFSSAFGYPGNRFVLKAHLPKLPNGKHDINDVSKGLVRLSLPGRNRDYPEGDLATRRHIEQTHLDVRLTRDPDRPPLGLCSFTLQSRGIVDDLVQIHVGSQPFRYGLVTHSFAFAWLVILSVLASHANSCSGNRMPIVPSSTVSVSGAA